MPAPPTSDVPAFRVRLGVFGLVVLFIVATAGVAFSLVGFLDGPALPDSDYLWHRWPFLDDHATAVGIASLVLFVATGIALMRVRRAGFLPPPVLAQVTVLTLFATWLGFGYWVVTDGVTGANIGGGGVVLVTPVFAVVTVVLVVGLAIRASRATERS